MVFLYIFYVSFGFVRSCNCIRQTRIIGTDDRTVPQETKDNVVPEPQSEAKVENKTEKGSLVVENDANNQQLAYYGNMGLRISKVIYQLMQKEGGAVANHAKSCLFHVILPTKYSNIGIKAMELPLPSIA